MHLMLWQLHYVTFIKINLIKMIDSLSGILIKKDPSAAIIDIGGVRLKVFVTVGS